MGGHRVPGVGVWGGGLACVACCKLVVFTVLKPCRACRRLRCWVGAAALLGPERHWTATVLPRILRVTPQAASDWREAPAASVTQICILG